MNLTIDQIYQKILSDTEFVESETSFKSLKIEFENLYDYEKKFDNRIFEISGTIQNKSFNEYKIRFRIATDSQNFCNENYKFNINNLILGHKKFKNFCFDHKINNKNNDFNYKPDVFTSVKYCIESVPVYEKFNNIGDIMMNGFYDGINYTDKGVVNMLLNSNYLSSAT